MGLRRKTPSRRSELQTEGRLVKSGQDPPAKKGHSPCIFELIEEVKPFMGFIPVVLGTTTRLPILRA